MKRSLMDEVGVLLLRHGYTVKTLAGSSFDMVARKESRVLMIKVLEDANSVSGEYASSMRNLGSYIGASPIIVAEKAGRRLEDGVVYSRFGVYTFSCSTLSSCLENRFPIIISTKAGFAASVIGERLRQQREGKGLSLGTISRKVGVSKRMIAKYEADSADVTLRSAIALNRIFGSEIFGKVDIFGVAEEAVGGKNGTRPSVIAKKYYELGFRASDTKKAPFDVVAKLERELILTDVSKDKANPQLESMRQLLGADALVIFDKDSKNNKKGIPSLQKRDFMEMGSAKELIKFLKEFE
ncbi:helix-turn-helix domain-containing protein [Candidatus Woesearchaeota archaeon]|nr:helix-turn-helix domain-containing protein [Candidatus Woesearchaeota archaeon]